MKVKLGENVSVLVVAAFVALLAAGPAAHAADGTWLGASGAWSAFGTWSGGIVADGANNTANFTGVNIAADQTITLNDVGRTIGNITFTDATTSSHNLIISGANTLTLDVTAGSPTVNVTQSGRKLFISSVIAGNDGLQKTGAGELRATGANTFTGGVNLNAGSMVVFDDPNESSFLGDTANVVTFTGNATLHNDNMVVTLPQGITIDGGVTATLTGAFAERTELNGVLAGSGTMVVQGFSANWIFEARNTANTFTGPIQVISTDFATLRMRSLADSASKISLQSNVNNGGKFEYMSGAIAPLVLNSRQFELITNGDAGTNLTRQPSILSNAAGANTITVNTDLLVTATGNKHFVLGGANTGDNTFAGIIPDAIGASVLNLHKQDGGKWILGNAANSYAGITNISGGTLEVKKLANGGANSSIGASGSAAANLLLGNATTLLYTGSGDSTDRGFTINGTAAGNSATLNSSGTGAVDFTSTTSPAYGTINQTRTLNLAGTNLDINMLTADIDDNGTGLVSVTKQNAGRWRLTGNSSYTGVTNITGGILEVAKLADGGSNSSIGAATSAASNLLIGNGLTLRYVGSGDSTNRNFTLNGTAAGNNAILDASGTGPISFTNTATPAYGTNNQGRFLQLAGTNTDANTLAANIANNGTGVVSLTKNGIGKWVLTGTSSYTGATTVNDGTLLVNGSLAAGSAVTVNSGATLGGTGTVNGTVNINAGGFLAPGNSIGTMNVGPLSISGTENMELGTPGTVPSPGLSDRTNVMGALTLNGGSTLNLIDNAGNDGNGFLGAGRYQLMTYTTTLSGTFTNLTGLPSSHVANVIYNGAGSGVSDGVLLDLFDHGQASLSGGGVVMNTATDFTLNFGTVDQNSAQTAALLLENLINTLGFTAGIDLDSLAESGDDAALNSGIFTNDLASPFSNLGAGANTAFNIGFDTSALGAFAADYLFIFSDVDGLLGSGSLPTLTLHVLGEVQAVPEPAAVAMWSVIGLCLAGYGARHVRRRRVT